jgi:cytochrome P450
MAGPDFAGIVEDLRRQGPLSWVESDGGYWLATSHELVLQMLQSWETFSSVEGVALTRPTFDAMPALVPIELDGARHRAYRKQLNPRLASKALAVLEDPIREIADELIDGFISFGACDIAIDFARKFPGTVFIRLMLHCDDDDFHFVEPLSRTISYESNNPERFAAAAANMRAWAGRVFEAKSRKPPSDDLLNTVMRLNDTGETYVDHELCSALQILVNGGLGTSASVISVAVRVLCDDLNLQERVRSELSMVPALVEECMRLEPPVLVLFRTAQRDVEVAGEQIKKGDKVGLFLAAANRDPSMFERPDQLDIDRWSNRHLALGAGVHRCIGSNLGRLQIRIAIEQLVTRLSPFWIPQGGKVEYDSLQVRAPRSLPLAFSPQVS